MKKILGFINSNHLENYKILLDKFTGKLTNDIDTTLKLLSLDEIFLLSEEYIDDFGIHLNNLLKDERLESTALFIGQLAYTLMTKTFKIDTISFLPKLDMDTRNFVISILYNYTEAQAKIS